MEDKVMIDLKAMIEDSEEGVLSETCCIYKVPYKIRELEPKAYTPKVVSIGPFHYGNERLQNMERRKLIFFKRFVEGAMISLDKMVSFAKLSEPEVRASYSDNITISSEEFVKLILVDACFIIELFWKDPGDELKNDAKLSNSLLFHTVQTDLVLLENQLPFFFLQELYTKAFPQDAPSFLVLTYNFFSLFNTQNLDPDPNKKIKHFTDLLRLFYLQIQLPGRQLFNRSNFLSYSANELQEAGVKFKASTSKCLLDLKRSRGVIEVPQILVEDRTEILFRNMIVLEQCHYPLASYICDYATTLDFFINTYKDVDVLIHSKVMYNFLSDTGEIAKLVNSLCKNVICMNINSEYLKIWKRLNAFYQNPFHKMMATLRRDYCDTPWKAAASAAGIVLLALTIVQTIFSVLRVVGKHS